MESRAFIVRTWLSGSPKAFASSGAPMRSIMAEKLSMPLSLHLVAIGVNTARSQKMFTLCAVTDPTIKAQGRRLASARKRAGFRSARAAALACGWKESSYRAHEGGTRTIGLDDANRYARKFRSLGVSVTAQSILFDAEASVPALNGELDENILQAALLAVAEEAAELPANEAAVEAMLEPLTRSVARYVLKALEQHARGNDNSPDAGSVRNHIRSAFQALFALGRG